MVCVCGACVVVEWGGVAPPTPSRLHQRSQTTHFLIRVNQHFLCRVARLNAIPVATATLPAASRAPRTAGRERLGAHSLELLSLAKRTPHRATC